jgi:hypothetical protein
VSQHDLFFQYKRISSLFSLLVLSFSIFFFNNTVYASDELQFAAIDVKPYAFFNKGSSEGLYVDFFNKIIDGSGLTGKIEIKPFARAKEEVITGKSQSTMMFESKDLNDSAVVVCYPFQIPSLLFYLSPNPVNINTLKSGPISRLRNGCKDFEASNQGKIEFLEANSVETAIEQVKNNRTKAFCTEFISLGEGLKNVDISKNQIRTHEISNRKVAFYVNKNIPPTILQTLKTSCNNLIKKNYFKKQIKSKFGIQLDK